MEMKAQIPDFVSALGVADSYNLEWSLVCILPWVHRGEGSQDLTLFFFFFLKKCIKCVPHKHVEFPGQLTPKTKNVTSHQ